MNTQNQQPQVDLFIKDAANKRLVPDDARFIIAYQADEQGIADFEEALYLRRTGEADELWSVVVIGFELSGLRARGVRLIAPNVRPLTGPYGGRQGRVAQVSPGGTARDAATGLLELYLAGVVRWSRVKSAIASGLLGPRELEQCLTGIRASWQRRNEAARLRARRHPPIIIAAAQELRLGPEPAGRGADLWRSNCPSGNHSLMINATVGQWGCGYCKRSGGVAELRAFVALRRAQYEERLRRIRGEHHVI